MSPISNIRTPDLTFIYQLVTKFAVRILSFWYWLRQPRKKDGAGASNDDLYRNNNDGTFSNVTIESGIVNEGFGLGMALGDVNKDGYPDIYISND